MDSIKTVSKKPRFSLTNLFFEDEIPTAPAATTPAPEAKYGESANYKLEYTITPTLPQADPKIRESLRTALEENSLGSYDYLKFKKSCDALKVVVPDEGGRFKASFIAAQTLNVSKDKLIETANHYLTVLSEEQRKFNEAIDGANKGKIVSGNQRVKEIEATTAEKVALIQKLTDEIRVLDQEKRVTQIKLAEDKTKIDTATSGFTAAYDGLVQEIKSDISKMQTYL